jgi:hypothetical protein
MLRMAATTTSVSARTGTSASAKSGTRANSSPRLGSASCRSSPKSESTRASPSSSRSTKSQNGSEPELSLGDDLRVTAGSGSSAVAAPTTVAAMPGAPYIEAVGRAGVGDGRSRIVCPLGPLRSDTDRRRARPSRQARPPGRPPTLTMVSRTVTAQAGSLDQERAARASARPVPASDDLRSPSSSAPRLMLAAGCERRQADAGDAVGTVGVSLGAMYHRFEAPGFARKSTELRSRQSSLRTTNRTTAEGGPASPPSRRTKTHALAASFQAGEGTRTPDLSLTRRLLYQLSYSGGCSAG